MNRIITVVTFLIFAIAGMAYLSVSPVYGGIDANTSALLLPKLSDYNIFSGGPQALVPGNGFQLYELATGLFTDYAEKQRLIKVPAGTTITVVNDGLPNFPDGTILDSTSDSAAMTAAVRNALSRASYPALRSTSSHGE